MVTVDLWVCDLLVSSQSPLSPGLEEVSPMLPSVSILPALRVLSSSSCWLILRLTGDTLDPSHAFIGPHAPRFLCLLNTRVWRRNPLLFVILAPWLLCCVRWLVSSVRRWTFHSTHRLLTDCFGCLGHLLLCFPSAAYVNVYDM